MKTYHRPRTVQDAVTLLGQTSGAVSLYAGGTDLLPRWEAGLLPRPDSVLDLKHIDELRGISTTDGEIRIGACTLMSDLETSPLLCAKAPVLAEAAGCIACPQIRNRATIGGNLCNASPAADTAVPLMLFDSVLELASLGTDGRSVREVPIAEFFTGPGSTVLGPGEILCFVRLRPAPDGTFVAWEKFGTRPAMEIAVASVGLAVRVVEGRVAHARVGYGSVAPTPSRGREAESRLIGHELTPDVIASCVTAARAEIKPITDLRASQAYRREIVGVMLGRMLERAACR